MKQIVFAALCFWLSATGNLTAAADSPKWIVATAPEFRSAIAPLVERRRQDGMAVTIIKMADLATDAAGMIDPMALRTEIERLARDSKSRTFVLLVGVASAPADGAKHAETNHIDAKQIVVPALAGTEGRMKRQPTDHGYGLPDEKMLPSIAVGRFPARTAKEAAAMVEKTLAFERDRAAGRWRNRLTVLEGNPGGGNDFERRTAEAVVPAQIQNRFAKLNPDWTARFVVHAAGSPYFVGDSDLRAASLDYIREGQFWTIYLGHSSASGLWSIGAPYIDRKDWSTLEAGRHPGLLFTCGCFACQTAGFDGEGYALAAIRNPTGPAAVVGAHCESYAMAGLLALDGFLSELNAAKPAERLADYWLAVENGLVRGDIDPITFFALDNADGSHGKESLDEQRREHAQMWTLLGDPAMRIPPPPLPIKLRTSDSVVAGHTLSVSGSLPKELNAAKVRITLVRPLGTAPAKQTAASGKQSAQAAWATLHCANSFELNSQSVESVGGEFHATLKVPAELPWPKIIIRATADSDARVAQGVVAVTIGNPAN